MKNKFEIPELSVEELSHALYEANLKLTAANNKLKEEEKQRLDFYANISHDLRAPVTAISNSIEYLLSSKDLDADEITETLQIVQKRTAYMQQLINDIFLLSSLESSDAKVHKEPVDLSFFLEDYCYMNCNDLITDEMNFEFEISEALSVEANIDPHLMQRVLDNLISNSIKYSKQTPHICLRASLNDDNAIITLSDNGIGIAKKHLPYIFDRSYTVDKSRTPNSNSSSGFGLSIVKKIIERHNGTISCESELNKGSVFTITLPLK